MSLIKHEIPILERDTEALAIIMPNRHNLYSLPKKCVFAFLGDVTDHYALMHNCKEIAQFESITKKYPIYSITYKGEEICFCQAPCGASAATQILDFLISYGVRQVIACGSCGALEDIPENDILIPTEALRDEGTSYHYIEPSRTIKISNRAINAIKMAAETWKVRYEECKTWTTDGFYRETKDMVEYRRQEGCSVVEMECSALAACSEFRDVLFGQILFAADILVNPDVYDERDWGKSAFDNAFMLSMEAVLLLNENTEYKVNGVINTERLMIRFIDRADFDDICEYGCDEQTGQYMLHWPKTKAQIKEFIDKCVSSLNSDTITWYEFVMQLRDTSKVIGNITLQVEETTAEIGWISNKKYWNNGYMSEAVNTVIDYTFKHLGVNRIIATCTEKNIASCRVMEKCNMSRIKTENNYKAVRQGVEVIYNKLTYCIEKRTNLR